MDKWLSDIKKCATGDQMQEITSVSEDGLRKVSVKQHLS